MPADTRPGVIAYRKIPLMDAFFQVISVLLPALLHITEGRAAAVDSVPQAPTLMGNVPQWASVCIAYLALKAGSQSQK